MGLREALVRWSPACPLMLLAAAPPLVYLFQPWIALPTMLVVVLGSLVWLHQRYFAFQYVFFLRYQLLGALALLWLPLLRCGKAGRLFENLFVLDWWPQLLIVGFLSVYVAWTIGFSLVLVYLRTAKRCVLPFGKEWPKDMQENRIPDWLQKRFFLLSSVVAFPLWIVLLRCAQVPLAASPLALGVLAAFLVRGLVLWATRGRAPAEGKAAPAGQRFTHLNASALLLVTAGLYLTGYLLHADGDAVPTLAYLLTLVALLVQTLSFIAFVLDVFRFPVLAALVLYVVVTAALTHADHYFDVGQFSVPPGSRCLSSREVVRAWGAKHRDWPAAVVVTASGGGIASARWTARVLHELNSSPLLGSAFSSSVVLISTVSGGGVGAMYFVDGYSRNGPPSREDSRRAFEYSGQSSLEAIGWGLAYTDFLRIITPWRRDLEDRAQLMERRWARYWKGRPVPTLQSWREGVCEGWRPAQVFNATWVETGYRFLVTPMEEMNDLEWDTSVVTAARLSATFPFVTPIARPRLKGEEITRPLHLADGGYYDNRGTGTAVDFLKATLDEFLKLRKTSGGPRKIILVEIRLEDKGGSEEDGTGGALAYGLLGPIAATLNTNSAAQTEHAQRELEDLQEMWKNTLPIEGVIFAYKGPKPLSWHLAPSEVDALDDAWGDRRNGHLTEVGRLRDLLEIKTK